MISYYKILDNRLDKFLNNIFPEYSRSNFKKWILSKQVLINHLVINKINTKFFVGDIITLIIPKKQKVLYIEEKIVLNIIYEDEYILIINKPYGLVVHPGHGNLTGTLFNALLYYNKNFYHLPRAGIVHRLDKDTTGLIIIAKDKITYIKLKKDIKNKRILRQYDTFVLGKLISGNQINAPIGRNIKHRTSMMVNHLGKSAVTNFKIIQKFRYYTHLKVTLETGRTHQIRVHMLYMKCPILGDSTYMLPKYIPKIPKNILCKIKLFSRQALHASHVRFLHPITNIVVDCYSPIPEDMVNIVKYL